MVGRRSFLAALLGLVVIPRRVVGKYVNFGRGTLEMLHGRECILPACVINTNLQNARFTFHDDFSSWTRAVDDATTQLRRFRTEATLVEQSLKRVTDSFQRGRHG